MGFIDVKTLYAIITTCGYDAQVLVTLEELAELQQALCKLQRNITKESLRNLTEEIADVELMLEQIKYMFDIDQSDIDMWKNVKLTWVLQRLKENQEN